MSAEARKAVVKIADMSEEMQLDAVDVATQVNLTFCFYFDFFFCYLCQVTSKMMETLFCLFVWNEIKIKKAMDKFSIEKDVAAYIKKEFDKKYNPTWHCIVGRNFGSYVTHETKHFIYFYLGQVAVLLFKSG